MEGTARPTRPEAAVKALLADWTAAANAGDLDAIAACYAPDIVAFDAIFQLQFKGVAAYRAHWQACLSTCQSMVFEIHDPTIAAAGDIGFVHYLAYCGGTGLDGTEHHGWMRATIGCRKIDGRWLVTHEHFSAPFDPISGKALFELQP